MFCLVLFPLLKAQSLLCRELLLSSGVVLGLSIPESLGSSIVRTLELRTLAHIILEVLVGG